MAQYGAQTGFGPLWTGFSGSLATVANNVAGGSLAGVSGRAAFNGLTQDDNRIANMLNKKANFAIRQLFISMIGAAPGALASRSFKQVRAQSASGLPAGTNIGGLVPIDTVFYINRNNTVTDDNNLSALVQRTHRPSVYPPDLAGVGGGGKAGSTGNAQSNPRRYF